MSIIEGDYSPESELMGQGNKEGLFVDDHDVDDQRKAGVCSDNVGGNRVNVIMDMLWLTVNGFALQRGKIGTPDVISDLNILGCDGTVWEIVDDFLTKVLVTGMHKDVL